MGVDGVIAKEGDDTYYLTGYKITFEAIKSRKKQMPEKIWHQLNDIYHRLHSEPRNVIPELKV